MATAEELIVIADEMGTKLIGYYDERAKAAGGQIIATAAVAAAILKLAEALDKTYAGVVD